MCEVSIIIPVYNVEKYVERCVSSALDQDFAHEYEILIIDDCGSDNSMLLVGTLAEFLPKGKLIRVIHHAENRGLGEASNTGIREAKGKYVFFLDGDDWIFHSSISLMYDLAETQNLDLVIGSFCDVWSDKTETKHIYSLQLVNHEAAGIYLFLQGINVYCSRWNKLYNTKFLRDNNIYCTQPVFEDNIFDFNVKCSAKRLALIPEITYYYARRQSSITQEKSQKRFDYRVFEGIICDSQKLIKKHFQNIPGVYDYYCYLVRLSYSLFLDSNYNSADKKALNESTTGFAKFVGSISNLELRKNRLFYIVFYLFDTLNSYSILNKYLKKY